MEERRLDTPAMRRISDWIMSQEFPSDITIQVGEATFNLHKLPLASRCGYIRKQVSGINGSRVTHIDLTGMPGGATAFELVTKFCYGESFEITEDNVAMLRCAAEHLEMTDDSMGGNLAARTEAYLEAVALTSLAGAVTVLRRSEDLLPVSEEVDLVGRCVDAIAYITCSDSQFNMSMGNTNGNGMAMSSSKAVDDWLADELTSLRIDTFQRVLVAMKARGFKGIALGTLIMLYAQKSLRRLDTHGREKKKMDPKQEHEKRVVLETIVTLLPKEKNSMSVSFLSMLLRAALYLDTTLACRLDLEKRMAAQLGQAVLDDLLIPSSSPEAGTTFDVDAVQRILVGYLEHESEAARLDYNTDDDFISTASPPNDVGMVGKLMESYLAEIASDVNLPIDKFTDLAEMIPERARFNEDGMYRAIDIYLKAHPHLSEAERKKVCRVMDCQKLSREACAHAAQNDRLPVQTVVQVLYHEQRRLREAPMHAPPPSGVSSFYGGESLAPSPPYRPAPTPSLLGRHARSVPDEVSRLQRENEELKMELLRLKMHMRDPSTALPQPSGGAPPSGRRPPPKKAAGGGGGFMNNVSKKLGRLNPFLRLDAVGTEPPKDRRRRRSIEW